MFELMVFLLCLSLIGYANYINTFKKGMKLMVKIGKIQNITEDLLWNEKK